MTSRRLTAVLQDALEATPPDICLIFCKVTRPMPTRTTQPTAPGLPRWRVIADAIAAEIRSKRRVPGDRIDPEPVLAATFGVNRHTVRQAIQHLAHAGAVRIERGRGTFVQDRAVLYPIGPRTRFSEILRAQGQQPGHDIVSAVLDTASPEEARHLGLRAKARVARVVTTSLAGGRAVTVARSVFPAARLPGLIAHLQATRSITAALAAFGHTDYRRAWTHITAELPDEGLAAHLGCAVTRPVLVTHALDVAADGTPLRFGITAFAGDLCRLVVEPDMGPPPSVP